jgi:hypothetical protein
MAGVKTASVAQLEHQIVYNDAELRGKLEFIAWMPNHSLTPSYRYRCKILRMMIQKCLSEYRLRTGTDYPYTLPAMPMIVRVDPRKVPRSNSPVKSGGGKPPKTVAKPAARVQRPVQFTQITYQNVSGAKPLYSIVIDKWGSFPVDHSYPHGFRVIKHWRHQNSFMSWIDVTRHSVAWRKPTSMNGATKIASTAGNYVLLLMRRPGNIDPNQYDPNLGKKRGSSVHRLGYYESWDEFAKSKKTPKELLKYRTK